MVYTNIASLEMNQWLDLTKSAKKFNGLFKVEKKK